MYHDDIFHEIIQPTSNEMHHYYLIEHFRAGRNHKLLAITPSFPFFFIGRIKDVIDDFVIVDVETVPNAELENREWYIHIDQIELFFIERIDGPRIPELKDDLF